MAHLPLHGIQTKAQRLSLLAHEVSVAGGLNGWIYRLTETVQPLPETRGSHFRRSSEPKEVSDTTSSPSATRQVPAPPERL